jgi:membrane protease YdiL (CAAX protease family)
VFFLFQIIGGSITYLLLGADTNINPENVNLTRLILTFAQFMFILVPSLVLVMLQDNNFKETFRLKKPRMTVFVFAIIGILVIQPFLQVYLYYQNELIFNLPFGKEFITQLKEIFDSLEATTEKLVSANSITEFLLIVIVIAVTPAVCEEFLFRGLVFKNFEKIIPASKAIFFTGLLFALFHFHPFNLIPLAVLGIFLTFIVYHSGSIYTAVVCHFINNFISALAVFIYGTEVVNSENVAMTPEEQIEYAILGMISLGVFIGIIYMIKKHSITKDKKDTYINLPPIANE